VAMTRQPILLKIRRSNYDLPNYIADFSAMMKKHGQDAIYYAHAGAGEIQFEAHFESKKNKRGIISI
jgi:hypothetical protein